MVERWRSEGFRGIPGWLHPIVTLAQPPCGRLYALLARTLGISAFKQRTKIAIEFIAIYAYWTGSTANFTYLPARHPGSICPLRPLAQLHRLPLHGLQRLRKYLLGREFG